MSSFKELKAKVEAELKGKAPSADKIMYEFEKVHKEKLVEMERLSARCKFLQKQVDNKKFAVPKFETQRPNRPSFDRKDR